MIRNKLRTNCAFGSSILVFIIFLIISISSNPFAQQKSQRSIGKLLLEEIEKHPRSIVEDIYKFIHQAAFGSEHAVNDTVAVKKWMENEVANLDTSIDDELINRLSPDGKLVRINLRPYLKKGFDQNVLLEAFVKTANNYKGSAENFKSYWKAASDLADALKFTFTSEELNSFFEEQSKKGFPAVHHSQLYRRNYKPAYRVVDLQYLPFLKK